MRVALDTNVLVYAEGYGGKRRCARARELVAMLPLDETIIPVQCLGELYRVLNGKAGLPARDAASRVSAWAELYPLADTSNASFGLALDFVANHSLQIWDAVVAAVASRANCRWLATEDIPIVLSLAGTRPVNPFTEEGFATLSTAV